MIKMTLLTMVALQAAPSRDVHMRCELSASLRCGSRGCVEERIDLRVSFEGYANVYRRCVAEACERYRAYAFEQDGRTLLQVEGLPVYATVASDRSIREVMGSGEDVLISRGTCRRVAPPVIILPPRQDE